MPGATLNQAPKYLALILELCEVLGGVEGWWDSVGDGESSLTG